MLLLAKWGHIIYSFSLMTTVRLIAHQRLMQGAIFDFMSIFTKSYKQSTMHLRHPTV